MKKINNTQVCLRVKSLLLLLTVIFGGQSLLAQAPATEYFMTTSYTKMNLNPALRPDKGYVGIPGLTNIYVDYKTNAFNLDHFIFPGLGENGKAATFMHKDVSYNDFMKNISDNNYFNADVNVTVLGFGFYVKDLFLNFDVSARGNIQGNIPKDVFGFVKKGVTLDGDEGDNYDFKEISADVLGYVQVGVGGSYPLLNKSLLVGAKAKVLLGVVNSRFRTNKLNINVGRDEWTMESHATLQASYSSITAKYDEDNRFDGFDIDGFGISGVGFGFDLGASFTPGKFFQFADNLDFLNRFTISASLNDVGFINWDKSKSVYLETDPSSINITGKHTISFDNNDDNSLEDIIDDISDEFEDAINLRDGSTDNMKTSTGIRARMNWGLEYEVLPKKLNVGMLTSTYFNTAKAFTEFTLGTAYRPTGGIELGLSYSFVHSQFNTFGASLHLGRCFFISGDYVIPHVNSDFIPTTSRGVNVQFGFAVPIGKPRS